MSSSFKGTDVLGNPQRFEFDDTGDYLALGILYKLWGSVNLKAEISYRGLLSDQVIETYQFDAVGNFISNEDSLGLAASIGFSLKF